MKKNDFLKLEKEFIRLNELSSDDRAKFDGFKRLREKIPYRYEPTNDGDDLLIYWRIEGKEYFGGNISWSRNIIDNVYRLIELVDKFKSL